MDVDYIGAGLGFRVSGWGVGILSRIMENQMEKRMDNDMETGFT